MNKKFLFCVFFLFVFSFIFIGGVLYFSKDHDTSITDSLRFKEEYESLNGTIRESDGALYNDIIIPEDNPVKYVNCEEAIEVLKKENAILYIGANWCPWCRNAIPVLFDVLKNQNIKTLYYLNLDNEKDTYEIKNGKLIKTVEGSKGYYALLDFLKDDLEDYVLKDTNGKKYNTHEKRIYMPYVSAFQNGEILKSHVGTVSLMEDQTKYSKMTEEQIKELYSLYDELVTSILKKDNCNIRGC